MKENFITNSPIRVGIVDDHPLFTIPFTIMLNSFEGICSWIDANSGPELLHLLDTIPEKPDIILMDVSMPLMDGIETTKRVNSSYPLIKVAALSDKNDENNILRMIGAGACAYLPKGLFPEQLQEAIHAIHNNRKYYADLYYLYKKEMRKSNYNTRDVAFTDKQILFIRHLIKGYSTLQIAVAMDVSTRTIERYRSELFEKMDTDNTVAVVVAAIRRGYIKLDEINIDTH